ncbi:MAG: hypothetical protein CL569_09315 [Alphaproteobacteria bacterium]|nr:hypothetical protein [Alphaproteobacteria bacterium]|tara:strand:+ start:29 stop:433 length:405 start_codon:yes stop_codon:yes gene_type:complete
MSYADMEARLQAGDVIIFDGGTGSELERRGVPMNAEAWCGPATLDNVEELEAIHRDYISAGAKIITTNTYASLRLMQKPAGYSDRLEEINRTAVDATLRGQIWHGPGQLQKWQRQSRNWPCCWPMRDAVSSSWR